MYFNSFELVFLLKKIIFFMVVTVFAIYVKLVSNSHLDVYKLKIIKVSTLEKMSLKWQVK